jgi:hypothetical protein
MPWLVVQLADHRTYHDHQFARGASEDASSSRFRVAVFCPGSKISLEARSTGSELNGRSLIGPDVIVFAMPFAQFVMASRTLWANLLSEQFSLQQPTQPHATWHR